MEIKEKQIFNLWDTNGRRSDILNALSIYLNILKEMNDEGGFDNWAPFPNSLTQLSFYQRAIEQSPEVFKEHPQFDNFVEVLGIDFSETLNKNKLSKLLLNNKSMLKTLNQAIEQRARHYTSNLVRFGFTSNNRAITPAGQAFINGRIRRDQIEEFLPFNDINILFLRQLMKLKIFTKENNGIRKYYSPFFVSLYLLIDDTTINKSDFVNIVQGINPYNNIIEYKQLLLERNYNKIVNLINSFDITVPTIFMMPSIIKKETFNSYIKNRKSGDALNCYYSFYEVLYEYKKNNNLETYKRLKTVYMSNKEKIKKAFCLGKNIFDFGTNGVYNKETFEENNKENPFLVTKNINKTFYEFYERSKFIDSLYEYSDTTMRALGATGLFRFKPNVMLSYRKLFSIIFSKIYLPDYFFGEMDEEEYEKYESIDSNYFGSNISISEILQYKETDLEDIISKLAHEYGSSDSKVIKDKIESKMSDDFKAFIEENYPSKKIAELLSLFSNRKNDSKIKELVNPSATVPTIYEYVVGIAWYYISNKDFDLYNSFNMTLNADYEPEMHATGGEGDITINYIDKTILIEASLMNKSAQKRGEWEPVLRHSLNNKAQHLDVDSYTFFIADELDFNTINIWRAVAAAPLRATINDTNVNGVIIMPFNNANIIYFLNNKVSNVKIINTVKESFMKVPKITEVDWFDQIINSL